MKLANRVAIITGAGSGVDDASRQAFVNTIPLGRLNTPADIPKAALFLGSDDASMVTGTLFEVDGGRCI